MSDPRHARRVQLEQLALNLEYAFNRGIDLNSRVIQLTEDIEDHHFDFFDAAMTTLETLNRKAIVIRINSYGGDVYTALGIIGRMRRSPLYKQGRIKTEGYGKIMSASTAILAAGNKRSLSSLAEFMHHEASYEVGFARQSEHDTALKESKALSDKWCNLMHELTGIPATFWKTRGVGKDFYLTPQQCIDLNVVDEVF